MKTNMKPRKLRLCIFERMVDVMKNNTFSSFVIGFAVTLCVLGLISVVIDANTPKCIKAGCNNERASGSSYCYIHKPYTYSGTTKSTSGSKSSGSASSAGSVNSTNKSASTTKSSGSSSKKSSSGSSTKKSSSSGSSKKSYNNSYDEGYEDVYDNDDYDWDRYRTDRDYANGVDDAMEDLDW